MDYIKFQFLPNTKKSRIQKKKNTVEGKIVKFCIEFVQLRIITLILEHDFTVLYVCH